MDPTQTPTVEVDVTVAQLPKGHEPSPQERADAKRWMERVRKARKHDEPARKQYVRDRRYARGDSGFEVDANLVGTYIDVSESFLYARNPDVDVRPARSAEPPSLEAMRDAAEDHVEELPDLQQAYDDTHALVLNDTGDPMRAAQAAQAARDGLKQKLVRDKFLELRRRFQRRQRDNKAFADTLEIVVSRLWKDARLKHVGRRWVRSALTIGLGVIKASWQERTAPSPETTQQLQDVLARLAQLNATKQELDEANGTDEDALRAEYQRQIKALRAQPPVVLARGFVIDLVPSEDFQIAEGFTIADHCEAPWNSHRIPVRLDELRARYGLSQEQAAKVTRYAPREPVMARDSSAILDEVQAAEADRFETGGAAFDAKDDGAWGMVEEIWDVESGQVLTTVHGLDQWVKDPFEPTPTTRFYPFFVLPLSEVDGQRHPQSLVSRSAKLIDEYNRIGSAEAEHRRRCLPGVLFHAGIIGADQMTKVVTSKAGEYTGVETTQPAENFQALFFNKPYAPIDPNLYDRQRIVNELERIWGIQEALSGAVNEANTATEAQIQQAGFNARTAGRRDVLESVLGELAQYTAEIARAHLDMEDVRRMAGPDAMWPEYDGANDLGDLVVVDIKAGSSGKPDTTAERQALAQTLPMLQAGIEKIAALRGSSNEDVADALERLLKLAVERSGDLALDVVGLLPQAGAAPALPPPGGNPPAPTASPSPAQPAQATSPLPASPAIPDLSP